MVGRTEKSASSDRALRLEPGHGTFAPIFCRTLHIARHLAFAEGTTDLRLHDKFGSFGGRSPGR